MTQNNVVPFSYGDKEIRIITDENGCLWWVAKDICDVLGIVNPTQAVQQLDDDERAMKNIGRQGKANVINESGLYTLILRSNKPQAKPFRKWVTAEVLPAIRRSGSYQQPDAAAAPARPESLILIAREFRAALRIARGMGLTGAQSVQAAGRLTCELTGVDPLDLIDTDTLSTDPDWSVTF